MASAVGMKSAWQQMACQLLEDHHRLFVWKKYPLYNSHKYLSLLITV